jgi:hypothetical protein
MNRTYVFACQRFSTQIPNEFVHMSLQEIFVKSLFIFSISFLMHLCLHPYLWQLTLKM